MMRQSPRREALEKPAVVAYRNFVDHSFDDAVLLGPAQVLDTLNKAFTITDTMPGFGQSPELQLLGKIVVLRQLEKWVHQEIKDTAQTAHVVEGLSWGAIGRAARIAPSVARQRWAPKKPKDMSSILNEISGNGDELNGVEHTTS